ncbi:MAG: thioredoxin [Oscillospiraceae bacterium]|nr:thioredoxin [Oscillospiraceae bacterium]
MEIGAKRFVDSLGSGVFMLVDFFAVWCGPCKMMAPVLGELQKEFEGKVKIFKIDIDKEHDLATDYGVMSVPTFILFKDGKEISRETGAVPKERLVEMIKKAE